MSYWLASGREGRESGFVKRFAPHLWTVNFPRPMMAGLTTAGPHSMRVDAVFYRKNDLAGLIWESEDKWDHPLLSYETDRDYRRCKLTFRWRSGGVKALDAVNGPTLTIEGRDASGAARSWFVRLWNYAEGSPEDAIIAIDFGDLDGGFLLPSEAVPVWAGDVDRMFISLVAPAYDGSEGFLAAPAEGWVEISEIACEGSGSVLERGDVMVPEHGLSVATGYDDAYNQAPERVLRNILALGYRGDINHYVGMSHYFRLEPLFGGLYVSLAGGALNAPCAAWHRDFVARAKALGFGVILSLSYELLNEHCWNDWKQRAENGDPALTGWDPPSALLSPAHAGAMNYLRLVGRAFAAIARDAGLAVKFQVGEPWWWIMGDGRICLYDDAARSAFGGAPVSIPNIRSPLSDAQKALLDAAGALLAASTAGLGAAVREEAAGAETHLLVYLPTVLDPLAPEAKRANVPVGWASPAFDVLQLEDYDWVTEGRSGLTAKGVAAMTARLGYPAEEQHYFAGFVLRGEDRAQWKRIAAAADAGRARGAAATFLWALPQICRDGFTYFRMGEEDGVEAFDDVLFPLALGREASVAPCFSTQVVESQSGHEQRSSDWADARMRYDAGPGVRSEADLAELIAFFRARRGAAKGFRFADPFDDRSCDHGKEPSRMDQPLGVGDGVTTQFQLCKYYGFGTEAQRRVITRPRPGSISVVVNGIAVGGWSHLGKGIIAFDEAPPVGAALTAGFRFDVPVRFAQDVLEVSRATFAAGEAVSVPLIEVREEG